MQLRRVLLQSPVADLAMLEHVLDPAKRMLDLGADARLQLLDRVEQGALGSVGQLLAPARTHRPMPGHVAVRVLRTLFHADVTGVTMHRLLLAVQQRMGLGHVIDVGCRTHHGVHQSRVGVHANVRLHAEVPLVTFLGRSRLRLIAAHHRRIALLLTALDRGRRRNQGSIDDGAFTQEQAFLGQVGVDRIEDHSRQLMRLQQTPKPQQCRCIRRRFARQIDTDETANRLAVVERILGPFVRQAKALLRHVQPQHALEPHGRAAPLERFEFLEQARPERQRFQVGEEAIPASDALLGGVFQFGEGCLHEADGRRTDDGWIISDGCSERLRGQAIFAVFP